MSTDVILFYRLTASVALRSECVDAPADLEPHCLHVAETLQNIKELNSEGFDRTPPMRRL